MNPLLDVRIRKSEVDKILTEFYKDVGECFCLCDDEECEGYSVKSGEVCFLLERRIVKHIAFLAKSCEAEL